VNVVGFGLRPLFGFRIKCWHDGALPPHPAVTPGVWLTSTKVQGTSEPGTPITARSPTAKVPPLLTLRLVPAPGAESSNGTAVSGPATVAPVKTMLSETVLLPPLTIRAGIRTAPLDTTALPFHAFQVRQIRRPLL